MKTLESIFGTAIRLAQAGGLGIGTVLLLVISGALVLAMAQAVGSIDLPTPESGPPPANDETPAPGSPLNTDPDNPGGGPTGGMG